ncbi:MAG TPA: carbohydrate porin [Phycisphaerae bacterium]|nr:carbohydrate porin [Phycisphaerae bacterium]
MRIHFFGPAISVLICTPLASAQVPPASGPTPSPDVAATRPSNSEDKPTVTGQHDSQIPSDLRPFALVLPKGQLTGDWAGARTQLESRGISPTLSLEIDVAANPVGGKSQGITEASNLGLDLLLDLDKLAAIHDASFLLQVSERWGSSLSKEYIGNAFNVQQDFGGETVRLVDAAYQQKFLDDHLEFRLGRIAANDDFQISPYNYLFMQNGFDGNPVGIYFNAPGMTAYPNATWGIVTKLRPTRRTYAMVGVYNGDPSIRSNDNHGTDFTMRGPVFVIAEAGLQLNGLPGDGPLLGNYKVGFWYDNATQTVFGSTNTERGSFGVYGLFDQVLLPFGSPGSHRGLGVFGSATFSTNPSVAQLPYFFTAGVAERGFFESRPSDICGIGFLYGRFSDDLRDAQQQEQLLTPSTVVQDYEFVTELAYRFCFINRSVYFQPDLQYIIHPNGDDHIPNALVVGCRVAINF